MLAFLQQDIVPEIPLDDWTDRFVDYVQDNEQRLKNAAERLEESSVEILQGVLEGLLAFLTITLLTFFFLSQSKAIGATFSNVIRGRDAPGSKKPPMRKPTGLNT